MPQTTPFWTRMRTLGNLRCRVLACLGAENPKLPAFFDPPAEQPIKQSLQEHLLVLHQLFADEPESRRIVAAGLLTFGELNRADEILSQLPRERVLIDHGAGWCPLVAYSTLAALLPLPEESRDPGCWLEGSTEGTAVRQWFQQHRDRLRWDTAAEQFVLK